MRLELACMSAVWHASKRATGDAGFAPFGCGSPALHQDPDARARRARDANRPSVAGRLCFSKPPSIVRKAGTTASRTRYTRRRIATEGAKSCRTSCMYQPMHDGQRGGGKHEKAIECCENAQVWSVQSQNNEAHSAYQVVTSNPRPLAANIQEYPKVPPMLARPARKWGSHRLVSMIVSSLAS